MRCKQDLERLEQARSLARAFQHLADLRFVPIGHCRNDSFLVFEVTIDQPNADPCLTADIMHAGLVKPAFGEADYGSLKDLGTPIPIGRVYLGL